MPNVPVHAVRVRLFRFRRIVARVHVDRHLMLFRVSDRVFPRLDIPQTPRRDNGEVRRERFHRQFEPYLVIAFARRAVRHRVGAFLFGDIDQRFSDDRPREGSTQQVFAFVHRARLQHLPYVLFQKFLTQIQNKRFRRAAFQRLFFNGVKIFRLAEIGADRDHFALVIFFQPGNDHRCIQPARIGKHYFFYV